MCLQCSQIHMACVSERVVLYLMTYTSLTNPPTKWMHKKIRRSKKEVRKETNEMEQKTGITYTTWKRHICLNCSYIRWHYARGYRDISHNNGNGSLSSLSFVRRDVWTLSTIQYDTSILKQTTKNRNQKKPNTRQKRQRVAKTERDSTPSKRGQHRNKRDK